jgi:hypothetical protein
MPRIVYCHELADGFELLITGGEVMTVTSADIPQNLKNQGLAAVQARVNTLLDSKKAGKWSIGTVVLTSVTPLLGQITMKGNG